MAFRWPRDRPEDEFQVDRPLPSWVPKAFKARDAGLPIKEIPRGFGLRQCSRGAGSPQQPTRLPLPLRAFSKANLTH